MKKKPIAVDALLAKNSTREKKYITAITEEGKNE